MIKNIATTLILCFLICTQLDAHSPHDDVRTVAVSPEFATDQTVFCSITHYDNYILKSTDGGLTWAPSQIDLPNCRVSTIVLSPDYGNDGVVFAGTILDFKQPERFGILKSTDSGASWTSSSSGLPDVDIEVIAVSPFFSTDQTVFAGTNGEGIYKSVNGGSTWTSCTPSAADLNVYTIAVSPFFDTDQTLFAGTNRGLYKSVDGGSSWFNPLNGNQKNFIVTSLAISPSYDQDQSLFVGILDRGVFKSESGGATWQRKDSGITEPLISAVSLSPAYPTDQTIFAATKKHGIFKSTDDGDSWSLVKDGLEYQSNQSQIHYFSFAFSPNYGQDQTVFAATFEGLHKSETGGVPWHQLNVYSQNLIRGIAISPDYAVDGIVFACSYGSGFYKSDDSGGSWVLSNAGLARLSLKPVAISPDYSEDNRVFCGTHTYLFKSMDSGGTWKREIVDTNEWVFCREMTLSPDFANDGTILIGNDFKGTYPIYKSTNSGDSFSPLTAPFEKPYAFALSPDFSSSKTILCGTENGVYRSPDGGAQWVSVGLQDKTVLSVVVSPQFQVDGVAFAGTYGYGLAKSTDGGYSWDFSNEGLSGIVIEGIAVSPDYAVDKTVFAATKSRGIFKSLDGGDNWQYVGLEGSYIRSIAISPAFDSDRTVMLGCWDGVYRTTDAGTSWDRVLDIQCWDDQNELLSYSYHWLLFRSHKTNGIGLIYSDAPSTRVELSFVGNSVSWIGAKADCGGIASVYIDDQFEAQVDLYASNVSWQEFLFTITGLDLGPHTIAIEVDGSSNPNSTGTYVFVDAFEVGY